MNCDTWQQMAALVHPLDPRFVDFTPPQRRIYSSRDETVFALVDEDDWQYFSQWQWKTGTSKRGKVYLRRTVSITRGGVRIKNMSLYLHIAIHERRNIPKPTPAHKIVDHRNGKQLDCRKPNLRWATATMNALNINGSHPNDLLEG